MELSDDDANIRTVLKKAFDCMNEQNKNVKQTVMEELIRLQVEEQGGVRR